MVVALSLEFFAGAGRSTFAVPVPIAANRQVHRTALVRQNEEGKSTLQVETTHGGLELGQRSNRHSADANDFRSQSQPGGGGGTLPLHLVDFEHGAFTFAKGNLLDVESQIGGFGDIGQLGDRHHGGLTCPVPVVDQRNLDTSVESGGKVSQGLAD